MAKLESAFKIRKPREKEVEKSSEISKWCQTTDLFQSSESENIHDEKKEIKIK